MALRPRSALRLVLALAIISLAVPAQAQTKPPIRGLVSMGAYKFVSFPGTQPANTMAPLNAKPGIFGGIVLVASWQQLQPVKNGPLVPDVIDDFLAQVRTYNAAHPKKPLGVKLRIWGGFMAPPWATTLNGHPAIQVTHNGKPRTLGRFWSPPYRKAWANLQAMLAARYDNEPLIQEVAVTSCMSFTAEPFFVPTAGQDGATVLAALNANGFTDGGYRFCLSNALNDYAPWQRTRLVLAVNPYRYKQGGNGDPHFTYTIMSGCRAALGVRCVFDNHDLNAQLPKPIKPIYGFLREFGPPTEFQTFNKTPANFGRTIKLGVSYGAGAIELYQDFGGFPLVPSPRLRYWANLIEANGPP
jgi:hypothetical protein